MDSPEKAEDAKAAFRKPNNDAANRKYRRHSSTSLSPPPAGSPECRSYTSRNGPREDSMRINDVGRLRKKDSGELNQTSGKNARSGDSYRYDRYSSRGSYGYRRHDDYKDEEDRDHSKFPVRTGHDSRYNRDRDTGRVSYGNECKRSRDRAKYSHTRYVNDADSYKGKHTERKSSSMEKDMHTREKDARYENRGSRAAWGDNISGRSSYDDAKAGRSDLTFTTKDSGCGSNESDVANYQKLTREDKKRFDYRETKVSNMTKERDHRGSREDNEDEFGYRSRHPGSPLKKPKLTCPDKVGDLNNSELSKETNVKTTTLTDVDNTNNLDAAKVAALRAAELVNKNLVGVGVVGALSTDQKKKLLWGSKKKAVEESGHCWDASLFPDREQQEKFNRLMGVKGEVKVEAKAGNSEGKSILDAEKQKELQQDLEKQYTAGLRRRDGRTVGLGL